MFDARSNTPMFSGSCNTMIANQQLILYETTNYIDVMLKSKPMCSGWNGGRAILGIQNSTGTLFAVAPGKNSTQWTSTTEGYRFSPAGAEISTVKWLQGATQLSTTTTKLVTAISNQAKLIKLNIDEQLQILRTFKRFLIIKKILPESSNSISSSPNSIDSLLIPKKITRGSTNSLDFLFANDSTIAVL